MCVYVCVCVCVSVCVCNFYLILCWELYRDKIVVLPLIKSTILKVIFLLPSISWELKLVVNIIF